MYKCTNIETLDMYTYICLLIYNNALSITAMKQKMRFKHRS